jgi:hypothetical protein
MIEAGYSQFQQNKIKKLKSQLVAVLFCIYKFNIKSKNHVVNNPKNDNEIENQNQNKNQYFVAGLIYLLFVSRFSQTTLPSGPKFVKKYLLFYVFLSCKIVEDGKNFVWLSGFQKHITII